ncbi:MAG: hemerythrin domain-containing protein [Gammaproteobacteria bacterium]|nr:hemerythrin domain-containing protein [Gammaproteobacteria bacterium]NIR28890.1 hemerythrin domain-containing protein [Gammaproteobacteria bacterium]NIR97285.1 hemerythrin domain-containing protein [Gammaproteobacteria bacterium]NIT62986.1 hemerythrin domain-containing protein [Gammaproteobacteria bacterium]NIV19944.1 hemerythrin domain-containing protein [Gammaproteobacteria bacterium]
MNELFTEAAPDLSDPLGLMRACHRRVLEHCDLMGRLAEHIAHKGVDAEAREAARRIHRYFSIAAAHHHQDEEDDLFPRLNRVSLKLADVIHRLRQDHVRLGALWGELEPLLARPGDIADPERFGEQCKTLCAGYREHIRVEEEELFDVAQHLLSTDDLRAIELAMRERREHD